MKTASKLFSAAFALAAMASIALPFAQPAQASGYADVVPEPANPAYQVFGTVFLTKPDGSVDMSAHTRAYFRVANNGGSNSGNILISPTCTYDSNNKSKDYAVLPSAIQSLSSGGSTIVWFDCYRHANYEGMPIGAKLTVRGTNEPPEMLKNNTASMEFSYIH